MKELWKKHRTAVLMIAPMAVFFALESMISFRAEKNDTNPAGIDATGYLWLVVARVVLMMTVITYCWRSYRDRLADRPGMIGIVVGIVGAIAWIGLCELGLESRLFEWLGRDEWANQRTGVNPFEMYNGSSLVLFLFFRFALLVIAVPIAEEIFLRGFFMRAIDAYDWQDMPIREISYTGLAAGTVYGMLSHPSEFLAAAVWFSMVTVLMVRTNSFWNCVVAHAVTNLLLGIYVCIAGSWYLW